MRHRQQTRRAVQQLLMNAEGWEQQLEVAGALSLGLVMSDDLPPGFLNLHHLVELSRFRGFAFADDLGMRFDQAHELASHVRIALEEVLTGLTLELLHDRTEWQ